MSDKPGKNAQTRAATPKEVEQCLEAIAKDHPGVIPAGQSPGEVLAVGKQGNEVFYLNVQAPASLPMGTVYRTWVVSPAPGSQTAVTWYRSRRGDQEDEGTLPPDDDSDRTIPS